MPKTALLLSLLLLLLPRSPLPCAVVGTFTSLYLTSPCTPDRAHPQAERPRAQTFSSPSANSRDKTHAVCCTCPSPSRLHVAVFSFAPHQEHSDSNMAVVATIKYVEPPLAVGEKKAPPPSRCFHGRAGTGAYPALVKKSPTAPLMVAMRSACLVGRFLHICRRRARVAVPIAMHWPRPR